MRDDSFVDLGISRARYTSTVFTIHGTAPSGATRVWAAKLETTSTANLTVEQRRLLQQTAYVAAIQPDRSFFIVNVVLQAGTNRFLVVAEANGAPLVESVATVESTAEHVPVELVFDPPNGPAPLTVRLSVRSRDPASTYFVDWDGDGAYDERGTGASFQHTYPATGHYQPIVTVRTTDGRYLSGLHGPRQRGALVGANRVSVVPEPSLVTEAALDDVRDLEFDAQGGLWALAGGTALVAIDRNTLALGRRLSLPAGSDARGFCIDGRGRMVVADTGQHRVLRLLSSGQLDTAFHVTGTVGQQGSGDGEFMAPADVATDRSLGTEDQGPIYVADAGNSRIQLLNAGGNHLRTSSLDVAATSLDHGEFGLCCAGGVVVEFRGRDLQQLPASRFAVPRIAGVGAASVAPQRNVVVVCVSGGSEVLLFGTLGDLRRTVVTPDGQPARDAVLFADPGGDLLLIAGASKLFLLRLHADPDGGTPVDRVKAMIAAYSAGALDTYLEHFVPEAQDAARVEFEALDAATRQAAAAGMLDVSPRFLGADTAEVTVRRQSGPTTTDLILRLDRRWPSGRWYLLSY
ncbi:MAG: hypothetical protein H6836_04265 [Planctomycetes bacterium]|nr:hypothetical protein [Planctomycetota bacterium]